MQLDDRALVYRGADQPDMSVINPESDVWQHIKVSSSLATGLVCGFTVNVDTTKLSSHELAHSILLIEQRWETDRHCRASWTHPLQFDFRPLENV